MKPDHWTDEETHAQVAANLKCPRERWRLCAGLYGYENDEGNFVPCITVLGYRRIVKYLRKMETPEYQL
jgi:hypothetical protein